MDASTNSRSMPTEVRDSDAIIYLLDDERQVVLGLAALLESHGFATQVFTSVGEFFEAHDPRRPGCLILDVCLPGMSGLELQTFMRAKGVIRPIVFVTGQGDIPMTVQAMKAGAVSFLPKPVKRLELIAAVEEAIRRDSVERHHQQGQADIAERLSTLTQRERQVMNLVIAGMLNKQIAAELGIAEKTIKVHRSKMMRKLCVRTPAALASLITRSAWQPPAG